jgi:hypothetical protein
MFPQLGFCWFLKEKWGKPLILKGITYQNMISNVLKHLSISFWSRVHQSFVAYFSRKVKGSCVYFHAFFDKLPQNLINSIKRHSRTSFFEFMWSSMYLGMQGKFKCTSLFQEVWPKSQHLKSKFKGSQLLQFSTFLNAYFCIWLFSTSSTTSIYMTRANYAWRIIKSLETL